MGCGSWDKDSFVSYSTSKGMRVDSSTGEIRGSHKNQDVFTQTCIHESLNPLNIMRECCDNEEHPNTIPVILALDVTGSMGEAAVQVAKKLNVIMTNLYEKVKDIEFCVMGIGDCYCDKYPIQMSQFESDIRIAEHLDKVYFEFGGGGNTYESYSSAWYMGARHTKLDCWKRGKKGIIITIGDEFINPYIPKCGYKFNFSKDIGDNLQDDIDTKELYKEASEKFNIFHIDVLHGSYVNLERNKRIKKSFSEVIGENNIKKASIDKIADVIVDIIVNCVNSNEVAYTENTATTNENGEIVW